MRTPAPREVAFIVGGIAGVAVIFLPFAWGYSPIGIVCGTGVPPGACIAACVMLLSVCILASTVRQAFLGPLSTWEVRGAYVLSFSVLVLTAVLIVGLIPHVRGNPPGAVMLPSFLILAVGSGVVLAATRKSRVPPSTHAHVAMLVAWMTHAAFCVGILFEDGPPHWGSGYYLAVVTLVAYAVEATLRVRAALRD
ncbi:MAG: hypothetical protein ACYS9X_12600 [Planctomycetota bacterium]|jgi:hypothetical protein